MKTSTIDELAYNINQAKESGQPKPIVFLGAGASKTGGIPLAGEIINHILDQYKTNPKVKNMPEGSKTYAALMDCLTPFQRNQLLKGYIDEAKINVTHIYLAQLLNQGYIDYVLTVNFDNLMLRALALFNEFPPTYDMAILKDLTTTGFKEKSVVYLHGQHHGLWLLNTNEELDKVKEIVPPILNSIKNERPWIFVGYSGDDPIFEHITKLGRFDNGLYWVTYYDNNPNETVCKNLLDRPNTNASLIKGYDADSFMLKLSNELGLPQPYIVDKPFTSLSISLNNIVDIDDKDHFKGVKERLAIAKTDVSKAIEQYEMGNIKTSSPSQEEVELTLLKKEIIDKILKGNVDEESVQLSEKKAAPFKSSELDNLISQLYLTLGNVILDKAKLSGTEELYNKCIENYSRAAQLYPEDYSAFYNWGIALYDLARLKNDEQLYRQSFDKYSIAATLNPTKDSIFYNWGLALYELARIKNDPQLFNQSFDKYSIAATLNPTKDSIFYNWGLALYDHAKLKNDEGLYRQSFDKYSIAASINPSNDSTFYNWGLAIYELAQLKNDEALFRDSIDKYSIAASLNPAKDYIFHSWGLAIYELAKLKNDEALFKDSIDKYSIAASLNPTKDSIFYNWGLTLYDLAKLKNEEELYRQSFDKYSIATSLNPNNDSAFYNWGLAIYELARSKNDEQLFHQCLSKFSTAASINPTKGYIFHSWGLAIYDLAKLKNDEALFRDSINKYSTAASLNPKDDSIFHNWGLAFYDLARLKNDEALFRDSIDKYSIAASLNPKADSIFYNWGTAIHDLARLKNDEALFRDSIDKYSTAASLNPKDDSHFQNWGAALLDLGKLKNDPALFREAITILQKGVALGGSSYNLSCTYALLKDKKNALQFLKESLEKNNVTAEYIASDDDWKEYLPDKDFTDLINKYKS